MQSIVPKKDKLIPRNFYRNCKNNFHLTLNSESFQL